MKVKHALYILAHKKLCLGSLSLSVGFCFYTKTVSSLKAGLSPVCPVSFLEKQLGSTCVLIPPVLQLWLICLNVESASGFVYKD